MIFCFTKYNRCVLIYIQTNNLFQGGRKLILDGGTQVNTRKFILQNYSSALPNLFQGVLSIYWGGSRVHTGINEFIYSEINLSPK